MRFSIYNRFDLEVVRNGGRWEIFRSGAGVRVPCNDLIIPDELTGSEIATYLDDLFHELSGPGDSVRLIGS